MHDASSPDDTSPFTVSTGERYNHFYYAVPWPTGTIATSYGVVVDNPGLSIHAWAFGLPSSATAPGTVERNVTGTLLGQSAALVGAWATGSCYVRLPTTVGLRLPARGERILVQWHHLNGTDAPQQDSSAFRICTLPPGSRTHLAGLTILGTENLNGLLGAAPGTQRFSGSCNNDSDAPITIVALAPHMHQLGVRAAGTVQRAAGDSRLVFDQAFEFGAGRGYALRAPIILDPGDSFESTCTYDNTTPNSVLFGTSVHEEMCYLFALAYPAGALDNGVLSLIGATNTCW